MCVCGGGGLWPRCACGGLCAGELWGKLCVEGLLQCVHMYSVAWESFVFERNWVGGVYGSSCGGGGEGGCGPDVCTWGGGCVLGSCVGELCWRAVCRGTVGEDVRGAVCGGLHVGEAVRGAVCIRSYIQLPPQEVQCVHMYSVAWDVL